MNGGIRLDNVTVRYDHRAAISDVSGTFVSGSLTAIVGPNGAGKTTLLKTIAGMSTPTAGRVEYFGQGACPIAYLPQQAEIDRSFPITVLDTVTLGHWRHIGLFKALSNRLRDEAHQALDAVGLDGFGQRPISALSAGQFQRLLFARLLLQNCSIILLDEPFNAIDAATTRDLVDVVHSWHAERRTVIAVLHDLEQVRTHFPNTLLLEREVRGWGDTAALLDLPQPASSGTAPAITGTRTGVCYQAPA